MVVGPVTWRQSQLIARVLSVQVRVSLRLQPPRTQLNAFSGSAASRGRHESPLVLEPNGSISLSTPRDPATGRRSEVRPEVGLPEAPLEREDD